MTRITGGGGPSFDRIGLVPVVFAYALHKQELTFEARCVGNAMGGARRDLVPFADTELIAMIGTAGLNHQRTAQHEIIIRALAVIMPRNDIAGGERKNANLNVGADRDRLD